MLQAAGWECCQHGYMVELLLEYQLNQLALGPWPVNESTYRRVRDEQLSFNDATTLWRHTERLLVRHVDEWRLYAAIDFLANAIPGLSAAEMLQSLPASGNVVNWLTQVSASSELGSGQWVLENLDQAWQIVTLQGTLTPEDPPIERPDESFLLSCTTAEIGDIDRETPVYRYDIASGEWEDLIDVEGYLWTSPLPDPATLLMQGYSVDQDMWLTNLWRDNARTLAYETVGGFSVSFGEADPTGRYLVSYVWDTTLTNPTAVALDLTQCDEEGCEATHLLGLPIWSPDGSQVIMQGNDAALPEDVVRAGGRVFRFGSRSPLVESSLALGPGPIIENSRQLTDIGAGYAPFWLDNETYGYIRLVAPQAPDAYVGQEVVLGSVNSDAVTPILSSTDFPPILGTTTLRRLTLGYVMPHPIARQKLFIYAVNEIQNEGYIILYDLETGQAETRIRLGNILDHSLGFSDDGRFLTVSSSDQSGQDADEQSGLLYLHDIEQNQTTQLAMRMPTFFSSVNYDWTPDGDWLLIALDQNLLALAAPEYGFVQPIPHPYGICESVTRVRPSD